MSRVAYVDGQYLPFRSAAVHIEDRGYQFADGSYEVLAVVGGRPVDEEPHLARLARSLGELRIPAPLPDAALKIDGEPVGEGAVGQLSPTLRVGYLAHAAAP
jgi:D-alanine transaminase